jgi:8-amino-3,8-dideoxy-alpha-D-manno-octulosonate transaminase
MPVINSEEMESQRMTDPKDASKPQPAISGPLPPMYPGGMRLDDEEEQAVIDVIRSKRLFRYYGPNPGPSKVAELEQAFARYMGAGHAIAVTSGTAALITSLEGLGIGPGDEVIVPAYTWIASASAVVAVGAVPIMAEVDESLTLDQADIENKLSPYTKAIIPVHMRGAPCRMDAIMEVARRHNLKVLEDVAQADGASYHGQRLGTYGDAGAFSLQFNKIITSGEGGMLITSSQEVFERAVMYHDTIGGQRNNIPEERALPGINFRMPELLGAVALVQLKRLDGLLGDMRQRKQMLKGSIAGAAQEKGVQFRTIHDPQGDAAVAMVMLLPDAPAAVRFKKGLEAEDLGSALLYSPENTDYHVYCHWSPIMAQRSWTPEGGPWRNHPRKVTYTRDMCPRSLELLGRAVAVDISPDLTNTQLEEMAEAITKVMGEQL